MKKIKLVLKKPEVNLKGPPEEELMDQPSMVLPPISPEQLAIAEHVSKGHNVIVDAVAGSGKTTTNLYLAQFNPHQKILLLTYNAKLKLETRYKVQQMGFENIEVHSYHSFCVKYFYRQAYTDSGILHFLKLNDNTSVLRSFDYNLIILDEVQDMNPTYYQVVQHIIHRLSSRPQMVVMGDYMQSIYAFNHADPRFLTKADQLYASTSPDSPSPPERQWVRCTLSTSYRLTTQITSFLTGCCQGSVPIMAVKSGPRVSYVICDVFASKPFTEIKGLIDGGLAFQDLFILAPSVRSENSPVRMLANKLSQYGYPLYVPGSDEEKLDEEILVGKIVFSTFHQVKGLERPVVVVFGFDHSYYDYYAKDIPPCEWTRIPNTLYVALTRAQEKLVIFHHKENYYLDFINIYNLNRFCHVDCTRRFNPRAPKMTSTSTKIKELVVTEMVRYVPVTVLEQCMESVRVEKLPTDRIVLDLPIKVQQKDLYEGVSEITGTAIPSYYEYKISGQMTIYNHLINGIMSQIHNPCAPKCLLDDTSDGEGGGDNCTRLQKLYQFITQQELSPNVCRSLLELSLSWVSLQSGYDFKKKQITKFDWLAPEILNLAVQHLNTLFPPEQHKDLEFEKPLVVRYKETKIIGFADIYNQLTHELWELKTVTSVDTTHFLQVVLYQWLLIKTATTPSSTPIIRAHLYNILTNEHFLLHIDAEKLDTVVDILYQNKVAKITKQKDQQFIDECQRVLLKFASHKH